MVPIGARLKILNNEDVKAWNRLYHHVLASRQGMEVIRKEENRHCGSLALEAGSCGFARCKEVDRRIAEKDHITARAEDDNIY